MKDTGCYLVSWDFSHGKDKAILLVGQKETKEEVKIVNAFEGKEALDIYKRLATPNKKGTDE